MDFSDLDLYYPGSKEKRRTVPDNSPQSGAVLVSPVDEAVELLGDPVVMSVKGRDVEFFYIGQLARALGRSPITLRRWEDNGVIPRSGYTKPSKDPRGKRRLYTRGQCESVIRIAFEEGLLNSKRAILGTKFTERVTSRFKELKRR